MTDVRSAAESLKALTRPDPNAAVSAVSVKFLQRMVGVDEADAQVASVAVNALQVAQPVDLASDIAVKVLQRIGTPVEPLIGPDFQWRRLGADAWSVDVTRSNALLSWSITYGRTDSNGRTQALVATVALAGVVAGNCPQTGETFRLAISDQIAEDLGIDYADAVRFTGEVTDPAIDPRNPVSDVYTIVAAGRLGRARRRPIDGRGWPTQLDGSRVARIIRAAAPEVLGYIDSGTAPILQPETTATAGQMLDQVTDSTLGQVVEQPTGRVDWHDADHRRGATVVLELTDDEILNDLTWAQHVGDLVNHAEIAWGRSSDTVTVTDPASVAQRETFPVSLSTALASESDAYDLGSTVVARRSEPVWQLPRLLVDLRRSIGPAKRAELLGLRFGDRIRVTGFPDRMPYPGAVELFVEGWIETATPQAWTLSIAVSDPALSGVSLRWMDANDDTTWDDVDPALTWLDVALLEDPDDLEA